MQALGAGQALPNETFTVATIDGTTQVVTVSITGVNDAAVLGSATVTLTETNVVLSTGGTLTISDIDSPATFVPQLATVGTYGTFTINAAGAWTYTASSAHNEFVAGTTYAETFNVASADGTPSSVTVSILGTNDAPVASAVSASGFEDPAARIADHARRPPMSTAALPATASPRCRPTAACSLLLTGGSALARWRGRHRPGLLRAHRQLQRHDQLPVHRHRQQRRRVACGHRDHRRGAGQRRAYPDRPGDDHYLPEPPHHRHHAARIDTSGHLADIDSPNLRAVR